MPGLFKNRCVWLGAFGLVGIPELAFAWPAELDWAPYTLDGSVILDSAENPLNPKLDLVGTDAAPGLLWSYDNTYWYGRIQLDQTPVAGLGLVPGEMGMMIDTDGDLADFEWEVYIQGGDGDLVVRQNSGDADGLEILDANYTVLGQYGDVDSGDVRVFSTSGLDYIDFRLPRNLLVNSMSFSAITPFRVVGYSSPSFNNSRLDVTSCTNSCIDLTILWSDVEIFDTDEDGLDDRAEVIRGSNPVDADSDDDGRLDGEESELDVDADNLPEWADCDSDSDGILDSVEVGLASPHSDTNLSAECFVADANGASTTNPLDPDTDGGGRSDGAEDWNGNGAVDPWETDPTLGSDDVDNDLDGIPDTVEGLADIDGDSLGNALDTDSDGDGLRDVDEGLDDPDDDDIPNFLDDDSDGDGILDLEEGEEDLDDDSIPNVLDTDSDGDGILDELETGYDVDCDGISDAFDLDDDNSVCESDIPEVDTGEFEEPNEDTPPIPLGRFTGGPCSSGAGTTAVLPALLAILLIRRRWWLGALGLSAMASAQEVDAQRFRPAFDGRFVRLEDAELPKGWHISGNLWSSAADDLLLYRFGNGTELTLLDDVISLNPVVAGGWGPIRMGVDVPIHVSRQGYRYEEGGNIVGLGPAMGDIRIGAKLAPWRGRRFGGSLWANAKLPTGDEHGWVGDSMTRVDVGASGTVNFGGTTMLMTSGFRSGAGEYLAAHRLGPTWLWGLGWSQQLVRMLRLIAEAEGEGAGGWEGWPVELTGSLEIRPWQSLMITAGGSIGLTSGIGAPDWRALLGMGWRPLPPKRSVVQVKTTAKPAAVATTIDVVDPRGNSVKNASIRLLVGEVIGEYPAPEGRLILSLPPGPYEIAATAREMVEGRMSNQVPEGTSLHHVTITVTPIDDLGHLMVRTLGPSGRPVAGATVHILGTLGTPLRTGPDGLFEADLIPGEYEVAVTAPGWTSSQRSFKLEPQGKVDLNVYLEPHEMLIDSEHQEIFLNRKVFFELDRAELKVESLTILDDLAKLLSEHSEIRKISIEGHTDSQGIEEYNLSLSRARAKAVVDYLIKQGVSSKRLVSEGHGESRLLQQGESEDVHATNRRVEFHILEWEGR